MYIKLANRCKIINIKGIYMVGCPISHIVFGLSEEGYHFVNETINGIDIDIDSLNENIRVLYIELEKNRFFSERVNDTREKTAYLHVTKNCNMNCIGCYSESNNRKEEKDMSLEDILYVIDNLENAGINNVVISGGEPFLNKDILEILKYMKNNKHFKITCITNGTINKNKYIEALKYLDKLLFSMDGISEDTSTIRKSSFKMIDFLLDEFVEENYSIGIIFTLHKKNFHLYTKMGEYAKQKNVTYNFSLFTAKPSQENNQFLLSDEELLILSNQFNEDVNIMDTSVNRMLGCKTCCGAGKTLLSISADGNIYPCHMMHESKFYMGNAIKDDILEIVNKISPYGYINVEDKKECSKCEYAYICGGGCMYRAYALYGDIKEKDQLCQLTKNEIYKILKPYIK